jgi:hypothetical protein
MRQHFVSASLPPFLQRQHYSMTRSLASYHIPIYLVVADPMLLAAEDDFRIFCTFLLILLDDAFVTSTRSVP